MMKKIWTIPLLTVAAAGMVAGGCLIDGTYAHAEEEDLIVFENFDNSVSLGGEYEIVDGGVNQGGKALKVGADKFAEFRYDELKTAEEITLNAWTNITQSAYALFSTEYNGVKYMLRGGLIADSTGTGSADAWTNEEGGCVVSNGSWSGIYGSSAEDWFCLTVTVSPESVRFYKDGELKNSYYTAKDRSNMEISNFIRGFYNGLRQGVLFVGSPSFNEADKYVPYLVDELSVYSFSAESPSELEYVMSAKSSTGYIEKAETFFRNLSVSVSDVIDPILYYDFNDDSVSYPGWNNQVKNGVLELNDGFLTLPSDLFEEKQDNSFTISMTVEADLSRNTTLFLFMNSKNSNFSPFYNGWYSTSQWLVTDFYRSEGNEYVTQWQNTILLEKIGKFNYTLTCDGSTVKTYINGVMWNSSSIDPETTCPLNSFDDLSVGRGFWDRFSMVGTIDDLYVFGEALDAPAVEELSNKVIVEMDVPLSVTTKEEAVKRAELDFGAYEDRFASIPKDPVIALFESKTIDPAGQEPQTATFSIGYTKYEVKYRRRDLQNYVTTETVGAEYTALPSSLRFTYSDGSQTELPVEWDKAYSASAEETEYTGSVTDASGRTAEVSYTVQFSLQTDEVKALLQDVGDYLWYPELYDDDFYAAYSAHTAQAAQTLDVTLDQLEAGETISQSQLESVIEAINIIHAADVAQNGRTLFDYLYSFSPDVREIRFTEDGKTDAIYFTGDKLRLVLYDALLESGYVVERDVQKEVNVTSIGIRRTYDTVSMRTLVSVYLYADDGVAASIEEEISIIKGHILPTVSATYSALDYSPIALFDEIARNDYTLESLAQYDELVAQIPSDIEYWFTADGDEVLSAVGNYRAACDGLELTRIVSYDAISDISCNVGTNIVSLLEKSVYVTYDNGSRSLLQINWDVDSLDTASAGTKQLTGTVTQKDGSEYTVSMQYIVSGGTAANDDDNGWIIWTCVGVAAAVAVAVVAIIFIKKRK